ncbi:MAG: GNAT family N-acetyltransferase [Bacteroidia bacterium]|nr:GNAT family N-acetyltransferase [Bacteroidia bacterium]
MKKLSIRPLQGQELALLSQVELGDSQRNFLPSYLSDMPTSQIWGLWSGETLVGFLEVVGQPPLLWIARIGIDQRYQSLGYGGYLLSEVIDRLRRRARIRELRAAVHVQNLPAQHLFAKAGFMQLPFIEGEEELVFALSLR